MSLGNKSDCGRINMSPQKWLFRSDMFTHKWPLCVLENCLLWNKPWLLYAWNLPWSPLCLTAACCIPSTKAHNHIYRPYMVVFKVTQDTEAHSNSSMNGQTIQLSEIPSSPWVEPASTVEHQNPSTWGIHGRPWQWHWCCVTRHHLLYSQPSHLTVLIISFYFLCLCLYHPIYLVIYWASKWFSCEWP